MIDVIGGKTPHAEISYNVAVKARQILTVWRDHWHY
jgi:hypothetical protein